MTNREKIFTMTSVYTVANEFIKLSKESEISSDLTNLKLQKLVYIAYAFLLKTTGNRLFSNDICAFKHGPVIPDLYSVLKGYKYNIIDRNIDVNEESLPDLNQAVINFVFYAFQKVSASSLVDLTHKKGSAWKEIYHSNESTGFYDLIPDSIIKSSEEPAVKLLESNMKVS